MALAVALVLAGLPAPAGGDGNAFTGTSVAYAETSGAAVDVATAEVAAVAPQAYTGKSLKPSPEVKIGSARLVPNVDYTLSYANNKLPGTASITIAGNSEAGYTGKQVVTFNIVIKAPTDLKAKVTGKNLRQITFSWKKSKGATGYKLYYSQNESFTKQKKSNKLKGDATVEYAIDHPYYKRDYYVKARAYRMIGGKEYYSDFTPIVSITTKNLKWILVDLSKQKTYCKLGKKTKKKYTISSGKRATPTIKGTFYIYQKIKVHTMVGRDDAGNETYRQPNVKWTSYFIGGYAFHATYWHNNFGHPMSHGCVNMRTKDAKQLYKWAPIGTKVVVQK